jgi:regulator of protease activity HflC (stomatin/prohibitin superfamily)
VPSGYVGVLWKRFNGLDLYCWCWVGRGTVLDPRELREEGLHIIWPWDKLYLYNLRLQSTTQTFNAISKDGVNVKAQISVRYQLLHNSVAVLHKFIGPDFLTSVVNPEIGSQARQVISQFTAEAVYTSREQIQKQIRDATQKSLAANLNKLVQPEAMEQPDPKHYNDFLQDAIQILDTLVLSIELPPDIVAAINRQTEQFYMIQEYKFRVEREAEESKRKQIEADGIAAFQNPMRRARHRSLRAAAARRAGRHRQEARPRKLRRAPPPIRRRRHRRPMRRPMHRASLAPLLAVPAAVPLAVPARRRISRRAVPRGPLRQRRRMRPQMPVR